MNTRATTPHRPGERPTTSPQHPHTTGRQASRAPAVPVWWSVAAAWMTTERVPGSGTNGTLAVAVPAPSSTVKSSHTSVSSLISGGTTPARTSVL